MDHFKSPGGFVVGHGSRRSLDVDFKQAGIVHPCSGGCSGASSDGEGGGDVFERLYWGFGDGDGRLVVTVDGELLVKDGTKLV